MPARMLSDCRVLDLTDHRAQLAGHILRSLGAEVILIEPPQGSPLVLPRRWAVLRTTGWD